MESNGTAKMIIKISSIFFSGAHRHVSISHKMRTISPTRFSTGQASSTRASSTVGGENDDNHQHGPSLGSRAKKWKKKKKKRQTLGLPWWCSSQDSILPMQRAWVWSLVEELRFPHAVWCSQKKKREKKKKKADLDWRVLKRVYGYPVVLSIFTSSTFVLLPSESQLTFLYS